MITQSSIITAYTISEISEWQTELASSQTASKQKIVLPSLQRGFVWKPHQIEALWDSILRGYPIGSILMSIDDDSQTKELLDGQQRCTSIALGFYNPFEQKDFSFFNAGAKNLVPSIWIDLKPLNANPNGIRYGIRVLTKSHPWGYQLRYHSIPLSMGDRNNALKHFKKKQNSPSQIGYTDLDSQNIYPYDSHCPVPLALVLSAFRRNPSSWINDVLNWYHERKDEMITKYHNSETTHDVKAYLQNLEPALVNAFRLLLPEITIQKKLLNETDNMDDVESEENGDATLFVRLNSEGTRISGEELIYSLFKSAFPESQQLVEKISSNMFAPSRTINLFIRLALHEINDYSQYKSELTIKNFRQELSNTVFKTKLRQFISDKDEIAFNLFRQLEELLAIKNEHYQLPKIYIKELLRKNSDLVVVILTYLRKEKSLTPNIKKYLHHLFLLNQDHRKTARRLFKLLNDFEWDFDRAFNLLCQQPEFMIQVLEPEVFEHMLLNVVLEKYQKENNQHFAWYEFLEPAFEIHGVKYHELADNFQVFSQNQDPSEQNNRKIFIHNFRMLADNFYWQRLHLIASQASYFQKQFKDYIEFEGIEDTNRPWDWDHIYPNSWVYNRKGVSQKIRWVVNLNGNFRALSYDENRREGNHHSPAKRLKDDAKRFHAYVFDEKNENYLNDWRFWSKINDQFHDNQEDINTLTSAIFHRVVNIYRNWYNNIYLQ